MQAYEILEKEIGEWAGFSPKQVVVCSSGTAALHLALEALQLPPGKEVIVPDYCMIACARAVTLASLTPRFVDCGIDFNLNPNLITKSLNFSRDTEAIMAVHNYGRRCDMDAIHNQARTYGLKVVEDLAEAHGVLPDPETDASCWSFYRNKIVGGEEGGAVAFKDVKHAQLARQLRCLGFTDAHDFDHIPRGHNYRLSNTHAQLISNKLAHFEEWVAGRRMVEEKIARLLGDLRIKLKRSSPWVYDMHFPGMTKQQQDRMVQELNALDIPARHGFRAMTLQQEYGTPYTLSPLSNWRQESRAARISTEVVYLPLAGMTDTDIDTAVRLILELSVLG